MKDNSLDGHRGKVALSDTTRNAAQINSATNNTVGSSIKCDLKTPPAATGTTPTVNDGNTATNFDDDYNEWELGIGDLIIDLDADIEKTNERNGGGNAQQGIPSQHGHHHHHHHHSHHQNGTASSPGSGNSSVVDSPNSSNSATAFNFLGTQTTCNNNLAAAMSNSKSPRLAGNSGTGGSVAGTGVVSTSGNSNNGTTGGSGTFEHQATVDKGLKMKIKRKTVGNKYSEAKHEIVQSDTKSAASSHPLSENINSANSNNCSSSTSASNSPAASTDTPKSKHSSSKGRNSSHREKKEKNRDKNSNVRNNSSLPTTEVNGVLNVMSPLKITNSSVSSISSPAPPSLSSNSSPLPSNNNSSAASPSTARNSTTGPSVANSPVSNCAQEIPQPTLINLPSQTVSASSSPPMPNLTLKLENKFAPSPISQPCSVPSVVLKAEDRPSSPPLKKLKVEPVEVNDEGDCPGSPGSPEMKDTSTCTSVGTITEPDCLGPCEPGTSVMLEGIVWQETEGGVLVVNVTWRGKTYVGTLLDCTKHDWAPPRFCESPTSDVDSKAAKGRGKRGRGGNNSASEISFTDTRNCVQSKLRNGKGRRTTINSNASSSGFTVPNSPAKNDSSASNKRKSRPNEPETSNPISESKTSKRSRTQSRAMPTSAPQGAADLPQPSSPQLITCPEPNCNKRYKHLNGLKYHRAHAHSASDSSKMDDTTTEDSKDVTNSSDNEESLQESASVSTSPAPSFANSVPSSGGKNLLNSETASSSSSSVSGLPENDPYSLTTDLSTLASVAISDSTSEQNVGIASSRPTSANLHSTASQDISLANSDGDGIVPPSVLPVPVSISSPSPAPLSDVASVPSVGGPGLSTAVSAVTTSVIQSSNSMDNIATSQALTMNIPTPHVIFSQGMLGSNSTTTCTTSTVVCNNSSSSSPSRNNSISSNVTTTFAAISSIASTTISSPTTPLPMMDKSKIKQERPDKYKPKSPSAATTIRPIVPAPTPLIALSSNMPSSHPGMNIGSHCVNPALKPIQPKPTILGEPNTVNPALESLKKEKSKHKKKSKDKDKERDKKLPLPLTPTKMGMNPNEECEALELTSYPSLEAVSGPLPGTPHPSLSPLISQSKPPDASMDMSLPEDTMNENIQSPAYSDISDANDTAPVLESEVPSGKEKEDKVGKTTPDASQSPATNISAYGMYPYYSQPPYLLPSVSPQSAVSGSQGQNIIEKGDLSKKGDQERVKENRPWSNPGVDARERQHMDHHELDKKQSREENVQSSNSLSSPAAGGVPIQEYPIAQHYPYPYGYVQGYPYPMETSSYHMHMLETDPHYKQQYKQYIDEHNRMYKEQQHHHQQQQLQQLQQAHQQQAHHAHHHSQHQSHHQSSKSHHSVKDERDRSRESKDRSGGMDKMSNSGMMGEHSSKIQHSSNPMVSSKDQDVREIEMRPPSLPPQARIDPSASSASATALKEKQNENHQILKENIELKSQMDESKNKANQYEMAMLFERHKEDMRRFYTYQDRIIEQQQQKMEPGIHHHTHHHQTIQSHGHLQSSSYSASLKTMKDDLSGSLPIHAKSNHYGDSTRSSVVSPAKSDHIKHLHSNSTSSPKGNARDRDSSLGSSKDYMSSSTGREGRESSSSKKDASKSSSERSESSNREDKKGDKAKVEPKVEPEGQKPTMETTGPPPPPTNSYAYLHPSYLQPPPPHFAHMPFEPAHAMYRGGINPMIVSTPHYANSPYAMHPQIRYVAPGACELPVHPQPPDPMGKQMHPSGPAKALDLLHQVSQQYTTTHKIHELADHAIMSPTPTSTPSSTPSTSSSSSGGKTSTTEPVVAVSKVEVGGSRDASRSPPTQRHLHTHHHTHVGVGYPIYDPYGVAAQKTYT